MKYNPLTQELYTDNSVFLKKLHCPLAKQWGELSLANLLKGKMCDQCNKAVYDTALLTEEEIQQLLNVDDHTCFKVDLDQLNLTITFHTNE